MELQESDSPERNGLFGESLNDDASLGKRAGKQIGVDRSNLANARLAILEARNKPRQHRSDDLPLVTSRADIDFSVRATEEGFSKRLSAAKENAEQNPWAVILACFDESGKPVAGQRLSVDVDTAWDTFKHLRPVLIELRSAANDERYELSA